MRFVVVGAGAIGGAVGARLFQKGYDVTLVARHEHGRALEKGLVLEAPDETVTLPIPTVNEPAQVAWDGDTVVLLAVYKQLRLGQSAGLLPRQAFERRLWLALVPVVALLLISAKQRGPDELATEVVEFLETPDFRPRLEVLRTLASLALMLGGAEILVRSSIGLAHQIGVSEGFAGLTLVGVGTSGDTQKDKDKEPTKKGTIPAGWKALIDSGGASAARGVRSFLADMATAPRIPAMVEPTTGMRSKKATRRPSSIGYGIPSTVAQRNVPTPAMSEVKRLPSR